MELVTSGDTSSRDEVLGARENFFTMSILNPYGYIHWQDLYRYHQQESDKECIYTDRGIAVSSRLEYLSGG